MENGSKLYDIYAQDGSVNPDYVRHILSDPANVKFLMTQYRVVNCGDDGKNYDTLREHLAQFKAKGILRFSETPEQHINFQRNDPEILKANKDVMQALGQSTSCEVPVSALPTPAVAAADAGALSPGRKPG